MAKKPKRAVIIGGGLGGLGLALRLSKKNINVIVCEKNSIVGGKMNVVESNGFRFDTGPSLITLLDIFHELYSYAGANLEDLITPMRINPIARYVFPDGSIFDYSTSIPDWNQTLHKIGSIEGDRFYEFMELGGRIYELSKNTFFRQSPFQIPSSLHLKSLKHFPLKNAWGKYSNTVEVFFKSPYLRQMLNRYPTYVGSSPYETPATLSVIPYIEYTHGGWYIKGGLYSVIRSLTDLAVKNGVEILCNAKVTDIYHKHSVVCGVKLENGTNIPADIIVMNGDVSMAPLLLGDSNKNVFPAKCRSLSGIVFLIGTAKTLHNLPHHTVYFSNSYEKEFFQLYNEQNFPDDPTVYVNAASRTDRSLVPGEGETLFIMANAPSNEDQLWDQSLIDKAWNSVFQRLSTSGFPDMQKEIIYKSVCTPKDFADRYCMPGGAIYGQNSHGWKSTFLRPPNKDRHYKGLYYVGGSTHPGGGTPMVLLSAKITANLIDKYES